jgi:hypothetical protein
MVKPEHQADCEFLIQSIFKHELSLKKVYSEKDLVREYYQIKEKIEGTFDGLDVQTLVSSMY